jgi:hypothetical protein
VTGNPASKPVINLCRKRAKLLAATKLNREKGDVKLRAKKRKLERMAQSHTKRAKQSYGEDCIISESDVSPQCLQKKCTDWYQNRVDIARDKKTCIEKVTRLQGQSGVWHTERKCRITASNVKKIACRNIKLKVTPIVNDLLYSNFKGNTATFNGLMQEKASLKDYKAYREDENDGVSYLITSSGLVIDSDLPWLAATPDGVVKTSDGEEGLVEVKNVLHRKSITFIQATKNVKDFCLERGEGGKLQLRNHHAYYYQVQIQMHVTGSKWVDFVVRSLDPHQLHIERIPYNSSLCATIIPKLKHFYFKVLLPELAMPRHNKDPGIREPGIWVSIMQYIFEPTYKYGSRTFSVPVTWLERWPHGARKSCI